MTRHRARGRRARTVSEQADGSRALGRPSGGNAGAAGSRRMPRGALMSAHRSVSRGRGLAAILAGTLVLVAPLAVASGQARPPQPFTPEWASLEGGEVFARKGCGSCHHVRGASAPGTTDLARISSATGFFGLAAAMWNHLPRMSAKMREAGLERPRLSPREIDALLAFLFTAQYFDRPGDPVAGERIFTSKHCVQCHAVGGVGGHQGPALDSVGRSSAPVLVAAAMWNHGPEMGKLMRAQSIPYPVLAEHELGHIIAYMMTAGRGEDTARDRLVPGTPERGKRLLVEKGCARCHAPAGGLARRAPPLEAMTHRGSLTEFAGRMWNHGPQMWTAMEQQGMASPRLSGQDTADIVAHLFTRRYFERSPGDAARGRRLLDRKGCLGCHSLHGKGGKVAPDLASANVVASPAGQVAALWNQGRFMETEARRRGTPWPRLTAQELADLVTYLAGVGRGAPGHR